MRDEIIISKDYDERIIRKELTVEDVIKFLEKYPKHYKVGIHIDDGEYNRVCGVESIVTPDDYWFENIKDHLPKDMVILIDGTCYHSDY